MSPSAKLVSLATAVPPNVLNQSDVAAAANQIYVSGPVLKYDRPLGIVSERGLSAFPLEPSSQGGLLRGSQISGRCQLGLVRYI